jgi:hypothetical protein
VAETSEVFPYTFAVVSVSWLVTTIFPVTFCATDMCSFISKVIYEWVWNGVHSALVRINEELLERKVASPV